MTAQSGSASLALCSVNSDLKLSRSLSYILNTCFRYCLWNVEYDADNMYTFVANTDEMNPLIIICYFVLVNTAVCCSKAKSASSKIKTASVATASVRSTMSTGYT